MATVDRDANLNELKDFSVQWVFASKERQYFSETVQYIMERFWVDLKAN